jgi:hypothetical protein
VANFKKEVKSSAIVTAIIAAPTFFLGAYFSNVHAGPGIEFLFWFGVFLLLPVYLLREVGALSTEVAGWLAIVLLEPLWLFVLVFGIRLAWEQIKQRYITVP